MAKETDAHAYHASSTARTADIVFVHGLNGHHADTWSDGDFAWPEWIAETHADWGVWSLQYPASWLRLRGRGRRLDKTVDQLGPDFASAGLGQHPIVFIAHSLGGLVVKEILRLGTEAKSPVAGSTVGVVFLSTPHRGASLASWARLLPLRPLFTEIVRDLEKDSRTVRDLDRHFKSVMLTKAHFEARDFYEEDRIGFIFKPVSEPDARGTSLPSIGINSHHRGICKPETADDDIVKQTTHLLERWLSNIPGGEPADHTTQLNPDGIGAPRDPTLSGRPKVGGVVEAEPSRLHVQITNGLYLRKPPLQRQLNDICKNLTPDQQTSLTFHERDFTVEPDPRLDLMLENARGKLITFPGDPGYAPDREESFDEIWDRIDALRSALIPGLVEIANGLLRTGHWSFFSEAAHWYVRLIRSELIANLYLFPLPQREHLDVPAIQNVVMFPENAAQFYGVADVNRFSVWSPLGENTSVNAWVGDPRVLKFFRLPQSQVELLHVWTADLMYKYIIPQMVADHLFYSRSRPLKLHWDFSGWRIGENSAAAR